MAHILLEVAGVPLLPPHLVQQVECQPGYLTTFRNVPMVGQGHGYTGTGDGEGPR